MKKFDYSEQIPVDEIRKQITRMDTSFFNDKIMMNLALYKNEGELKPSFVKFDFFERNQELPEELEYDYEQLLMIRKHISFTEFLEILGRIEDDEEININSKSTTIKIQRPEVSYVFSDQNWGYTKSEFPSIYYHARFKTDVDGFLPNFPLTGIDCPPYPNADKAIEHLFNTIADKYQQIERRLIITIPQFKAKIKSIKVSQNETEVEIESNNTSLENIQIQYFLKGADYTITVPAKKIEKNLFTIETPDLPVIVLFIITDSKGDVIDKKEINTEYMHGDPNVEVVIPDYTLKELIARGENKNLEFKSKLGEPTRFVRTVVAFANTKGGRIILGVDENNGKLISVTEPIKSQETISNHIAQYCDPRIEVNFQYSDALKVLVVDVPEGSEKPYYLKDEGVFVRVGATNRHASRSEMDKLLKRDSVVGSTVGFA